MELVKVIGPKQTLVGVFYFCACLALGVSALAQAPVGKAAPGKRKVSPYSNKGSSTHAREFYQTEWGVDSFAAKLVESGQLVRFSYRIVDVEKARSLTDKKNAPTLVDDRAHAKLVVPTMEKVGQLRQSSSSPEVGKTYWMVFSNKGRLVKVGDRVTVTIGKFHVDGVLVQ
jgi:hypothetical protein